LCENCILAFLGWGEGELMQHSEHYCQYRVTRKVEYWKKLSVFVENGKIKISQFVKEKCLVAVSGSEEK